MNDIIPSAFQPDNHPALLASVSELKTKIPGTYKEQVYRKALSDLAGMTFEPLAGLRVTFLPSMFPTSTFEQPENSNVIYTIHYVEYLTGHKRLLMAVVDLAEGYVPFNVDRKAFKDALKHSLEFHLNESGYTMADEPPDGLRKVSQVYIGHDRLEALFDPTAILTSHVGKYAEGGKKISVDIQGDQLVSSVPVVGLKTLEYRLRGVESCSGHLVARQLVEQLAPYADQDLVIFIKESMHRAFDPKVIKVVALDHDVELPVSEYFPGDLLTMVHAYRVRLLPAESQYQTISRGNFKLGAGVLSHHLEVTLIEPPEEGKIEVLDPENWAFLSDVASSYYSQLREDRGAITPFGDGFSLKRLECLSLALKKNPDLVQYYVVPEPTAEPVLNQPEVETEAQPPQAEERILPWTIFDRFRMAWRAFNSPDPLTKE